MHSFLRREGGLARSCKRLGRDASGNVAMLTGILLVPLLGVAGLAVDYSLTAHHHAKLTAHADAAALFGAQRAARLVDAGRESEFDNLKSDVDSYFKRGAEIDGLTATVSLSRQGDAVHVSVKWTAGPASVFGRLFNQSSYEIAGVGEASVGLSPYLNIYAIVDVSQSMGIGATSTDQINMFNREGCMFACHLPNSQSKDSSSKTTYQAARDRGHQTRVDVAREALLEVVESARKVGEGNGRIKIGVYAFDNEVRTLVDIGASEASNFSHIKDVISKDLILGTDGGGTDLRSVYEFLDNIPVAGDGASAQRPRTSVILISDGVANSTWMPANGSGGVSLKSDKDNNDRPVSLVGAIQEPRSVVDLKNADMSWVTARGEKMADVGQLGAFDSRICSPPKDRGVKMKVVETPYVIPADEYAKAWHGKVDLRFPWLVESGGLNMIEREMRTCATNGFYARADDGPALRRAIVSMGEDALRGSLRLTR